MIYEQNAYRLGGRKYNAQKKISLAGQFAERISEYVETPVTVTALAVESEGEQMIICSCDLVNIGENLVCKVRENIKKQIQKLIPQKLLSVQFIHTLLMFMTGPAHRCTAQVALSK